MNGYKPGKHGLNKARIPDHVRYKMNTTADFHMSDDVVDNITLLQGRMCLDFYEEELICIAAGFEIKEEEDTE